MARPTSSAEIVPLAPKSGLGGRSYLDVYRASPFERIDMIKHGVAATEAKRIIVELAIGQSSAFKALNLSVTTVNKKAKQDHALPTDQSERVIGMARLVGQLEAMIQESGEPNGFDTTAWLSRWLHEPLPAFGGTRPIDLMDTMEGQALVADALAQVRSGAYA